MGCRRKSPWPPSPKKTMATKSDTPKKKTTTRKPKAAPAPKPEPAPEVTWQGRLGQEMAALLLLGLAGFFLLALWSYTPVDFPGLKALWDAAAVHNSAGKAGVLVAHCLFGLLGLAAYWTPLMLLGLAWQSHHEGLEDLGWLQTLSGLGVLLASAGLLSLGRGPQFPLRRRLPGKFPGRPCCCPASIPSAPPWPWSWSCSSASWGPPACPTWGSWPFWARGCGAPGAGGGGGRKKSCRRRPRTTPGGPPWGVRLSPRPRATRKSRS